MNESIFCILDYVSTTETIIMYADTLLQLNAYFDKLLPFFGLFLDGIGDKGKSFCDLLDLLLTEVTVSTG